MPRKPSDSASRELPPEFSLNVVATSRGPRVLVTGELDLANTRRFAECLAGLRAPLIVDLSGLEFVDSTGIDALVAAHRRFGSGLSVECVPARCWRLFELSGLGELLGIRRWS